MRGGAAIILIVLFGSSVWSCGTCDKEDVEKEIRYTDGSVDASGTVYETNGWTGPYLHFPAGRRYIIEHRLGAVPPHVDLYLTFSEQPLSREDDKNNNVSPSAGNGAVIEWVDEEIVQVRNDTCSEFYLRVVAGLGSGSAPADAGTD